MVAAGPKFTSGRCSSRAEPPTRRLAAWLGRVGRHGLRKAEIQRPNSIEPNQRKHAPDILVRNDDPLHGKTARPSLFAHLDELSKTGRVDESDFAHVNDDTGMRIG